MLIKQYTIMAAWITVLMLGCLYASSAYAAGKDDYDANGDGRITFAEVMKHVEEATRKTFDALDRNKDGAISDEDFDGVRGKMREFEDWLEQLIQPFLHEEDEKELFT